MGTQQRLTRFQTAVLLVLLLTPVTGLWCLPAEPVLCGRVLLFIAYVFPLSERSGVNPTGAFHVANTTPFEEEPSGSTAGGAAACYTRAGCR